MNVKSTVALALTLSIFWLINSGYFQGFLLSLGLFSVIGVMLLTWRMDVLDHGHPTFNFSARLPYFIAWLSWEIIKSNIDVVKCILLPSRIRPTVLTLKASQQSEVGRVIYANSITMTPGTVTLDIQGDTLEVHALTRVAAEGLKAGEMDRQVKRLEK